MKLSDLAKIISGDLSEEDLKQILIKTGLIRRISNFLPRMSIGLDKDLKIIFINKFMTDTMGFSSKEMTGRKFTEFFTSTDMKTKFMKIQKKITKKIHSSFTKEIPIFSKKMEERTVNWHFLPIYIDSRFNLLFSVGEDISETKRTQEELRKTCEVLKRKNAELTKIIDNLVERELKMSEIKQEIKKFKEQIKSV